MHTHGIYIYTNTILPAFLYPVPVAKGFLPVASGNLQALGQFGTEIVSRSSTIHRYIIRRSTACASISI